MNRVLDLFDAVYVINLDRDRERLERITRRLDALEIPFQRFPALLPQQNAIRSDDPVMIDDAGCSASHAALLKLILDRRHETALILEDDAVFREDIAHWIDKISKELSHQDWDIFYLGLHLHQSRARISPNLGRVGHGYHAHAYAVRATSVPRILECIQRASENATDTFDSLSDTSLVKLYAIPILAIQEPNASVDRLSQYFGVFDGDEFENHCKEMSTWDSDWRVVLKFLSAAREIERLYKAGSPKEFATVTTAAIRIWPWLEADIKSQPGIVEPEKFVELVCEGHQSTTELCEQVYQAIWAALARRFRFRRPVIPRQVKPECGEQASK